MQATASDTIFSKSANAFKFQISMVLVYDLLECHIGVPLHVLLLVTGLELDQDCFMLPFMEKTKVGVVALSFDDDIPAFRSKGLEVHQAEKENVIIDALQRLVTPGILAHG